MLEMAGCTNSANGKKVGDVAMLADSIVAGVDLCGAELSGKGSQNTQWKLARPTSSQCDG